MISTPVVLGIIAFSIGVVVGTLIYRLYKARQRIKRLEGVSVRCKELTRMNNLLTSGGSVKLTSYERNMIRMALDYEPFRDMMRLPQTRKFVRDTWRGLREKIKESIKG